MATAHEVDIKKLEKQVTDVSDALAHLSTPEDWRHLLQIIHRNGWTTPAEYQFAMAILQSMHAQATTIANLRKQLLHASEMVGAKAGAAL